MHESLRRRILRRLDTLPEAQLYQVLDYIEFLESRYAREVPRDATGLQLLAERFEDELRRRTMSPSNLREAFQLMSVADRVLGSVSEAGRQILQEVQGSLGESTGSAESSPGPAPGGPKPRAAGGGGYPRNEEENASPRSESPGVRETDTTEPGGAPPG